MNTVVSNVAGLAYRTARRVLDRTPVLKAALKDTLLRRINTPAIQNRHYAARVARTYPGPAAVAALRAETRGFARRPTIRVVVRAGAAEALRASLESVEAQAYETWTLTVAGVTEPPQTGVVTEFARREPRLGEGVGEFTCLLDAGDVLWPNALAEVVRLLNEAPDTDLIYSDEDVLDAGGHHRDPFFKTDWNPGFLQSLNYLGRMVVVRTSVLDAVGGLTQAGDWDLMLRLCGATDRIRHVPIVLGSRTRTTPEDPEQSRRALVADLARHGRPDATVVQDPENPGLWQVRYPLVGRPLVSIVIPSKNAFAVVKRCIDSIFARSTYDHFEIVLVDTGSDDPEVLAWYDTVSAAHDNFRLVPWDEKPFSYARSCNEGARQARGDILLMLNNDTEVITPDWIEQLAGEAQRPEIGAVGCLLFFPGGERVQHAGVGVGVGLIAANILSGLDYHAPMSRTQRLMMRTRHDLTAVTAACLAVRKADFEAVGGFDAAFRITFNDVDLCCKLADRGLRNLYTPSVRLIHHESVSVAKLVKGKRDWEEVQVATELFQSRWPAFLAHDPHINPNLGKRDAFYRFAG